MGYVYRYTDIADGIIKYIGIVWSNNRTLDQRIKEHELQDAWCFKRKWLIEYIEYNICTRTDAEYIESHLISLYQTDIYFNKKKSGWGISEFLPKEYNWIVFRDDSESRKQQTDYGYYEELLSLNKSLKTENQRLSGRISELEHLLAIHNTSEIHSQTLKCDANAFRSINHQYASASFICDNIAFKTKGDKDKGGILSDKQCCEFYKKIHNGIARLPVKCELYSYGKLKQRIYFDSLARCNKETGVSLEYIKQCITGERPYVYISTGGSFFTKLYRSRNAFKNEDIALKFSAVTPKVKR